MIGKCLFFLAAIFVLMSCSLEVDSPQSYVLFSSGDNADDDSNSLNEDLTNYSLYKYELRIQGPDGRWRSGLKDPEISSSTKNTISAVSVLFDVPRLWVGRRYQFFICALDEKPGKPQWFLLGREDQKIKKDTNFVRVGFEKPSGAGPCREE